MVCSIVADEKFNSNIEPIIKKILRCKDTLSKCQTLVVKVNENGNISCYRGKRTCFCKKFSDVPDSYMANEICLRLEEKGFQIKKFHPEPCSFEAHYRCVEK